MDKLIENTEFSGERPLFASHSLTLRHVVIHAGESALKACSDIKIENCRFEGKYPLWHTDRFEVRDSVFTPGARAALWYSNDCKMIDTLVEAPKMFREMDGIELENVQIPDAQETLWHCRNVKMRNVTVNNADYLFMHSSNIDIDNYRQHGNYSFQYCRDVTIRNADIHSKDAFWNTENVTVINSTLRGEYLGWHSRNLKLINCHISGTQPLCYTRGLVLENCTFEADCDLAFEDSEVNATILSPVTSVKNPRTGTIIAESYGQVIIDENLRAPGDCKILTAQK